MPSEATASSSSKGGAINKSLKLMGLALRLPTVFEPLLPELLRVKAAADNGCGRTKKEIK